MLASTTELSRWLPWCRPDYARADAAAWIAHASQGWRSGNDFPLGIFDANSGAAIGGTGISRIDRHNRSGNLGYWTATPRCGQGVARAAARLALDIAFRELNLHRIEIVILLDNTASHRIARALGAQWECDARDRVMHQGCAASASVYSLLATDPAMAALGEVDGAPAA